MSMRLQFCCTLGVPLCERVKQVPNGKQGEAKNSAPEVEVVTDAMLRAPVHPRKQVKRFAEMGENDQHQTSCAECLLERAQALFSKEQDYRTKKQHVRWHQRDQCLKQCNVHRMTSVRQRL